MFLLRLLLPFLLLTLSCIFIVLKEKEYSVNPGCSSQCFPGGRVVKNLPANVGDAGDLGSIPGLG